MGGDAHSLFSLLAWGDSGYTDQIILGAPRSYEVSASFKW